MDVAEANKFINALVKNLQVLCHGHVNFNNSIQVIGHLYLNVDSDTNIDYIVNEKVCKNDSSSTVFVSKSYHSEPKAPVKPAQVDKRTENTEQNIESVSLPSLLQPSNRQPVSKRRTSKNIHPAFRDNPSSFQSPAKMPRLSLGEMKALKTSTPIPPKPKVGEKIMCIVKQEPGIQKEDLQSADHSNTPGTSYEHLSDDFNPNDQSYSNPFPIALHGNDGTRDIKLDTSNSTASPSQFGGIDGSSIDNNLKVFFGSQNSFDNSPQQINVKRETYDILIDIVLGRLRKLPQRERTNLQKAAFVRFYRGGKERWTVQENEFGENRLYYDNVECRFY